MILVGVVDINNSTSTPKHCDEPYGDLDMYAKKVLSAWAEVSIATWPSMASIMAPRGSQSGQIFEILGGADDIIIR